MKDIWSNWRGLGWQNHNFEKSNSNIKSAIQPNAKIQSHQVTEHNISKKQNVVSKEFIQLYFTRGRRKPIDFFNRSNDPWQSKKYHYALPPLKTHAEPPRTQGSTLIYAIHTRGVVRPQEGATKKQAPTSTLPKMNG